jgi:hypothetical protein
MAQGHGLRDKLDIDNRCTLAAAKIVDRLFKDRDPSIPLALTKNDLLRTLKIAALDGYALGANDGLSEAEQLAQQISQQNTTVLKRMFRFLFG